MRRNKGLFHSKTEPVPRLRQDIQVIPIEDGGRELLYFHDSLGYLTNNFALDANVQPLLVLFNGELSINQIQKKINGALSSENLLGFVQLLDQHRVLWSDYFHYYTDNVEKDFENSDIREPYFAGDSYPENPEQLKAFVNELLTDSIPKNGQKPDALYAPHIEISIGEKQYGEAFSYLKNITPKRVIILATSHYADYYYNFYDGMPFIGTQKNFKLPGRTISPDLDAIDTLEKGNPQNGFTLHDRAHRIEHSIEFHLMFASQIWLHDFKIIPVLVTSFDDLYYVENGDLANKIDTFAYQLKSLVDSDTFLLISGDLSHVGQKFGDREPAHFLRENVEEYDNQFIEICESSNPDHLLKHIKKDYDATRICGFPPLYTYLKMFPEKKGRLLNYYWWDEKEQNSAVSFGSILY